MKTLKQMIRDGQLTEARARLRELTLRAESSTEFSALTRLHAKLEAADTERDRSKALKIALLGVGTTEMIAPAIALALEAWGIACEIHETDYDTYPREMLDPSSGTIAFGPDVAIVVNSPTSLPTRPALGDDRARVDELVDDVVAHWLNLCSALQANAGCEIVLDNFHLLPERPLGNLAPKIPGATNTFLRRVNLELGARAPASVHINDIESLSAQHGLLRWFDARYWHHAKLPFALDCLPAYAKNTARIIGALYGHSAKCLVLDLDNTLWGGVIGDDGIDGIKLGQGDSEGEAFLAFQKYILELKARGVLLAVSSKNNEDTAVAAFEQHPEMQIKREDIVSFKANWNPKPEALKAIAHELNIGLDSLVFVDDNPREREIVRQWLPEVRVVEMSEDAADYPRLLDQTGWFEPIRISAEDAAKTEQYRANAARAQLQQAGAGDYDAYLESLDQVAVISHYRPEHLDRISQLANKSNQFNLTTRRQTRAEVEAEMNDPARVTAYVKLADRFGDNGLICVFASRCEANALEIDQWLMSCRVLNRGVEKLLLNWLVVQARERGLAEIRGTYIETPKNALVREHYPKLGFSAVDDEALVEGTTRWRLSVPEYAAFDVKIKTEEEV